MNNQTNTTTTTTEQITDVAALQQTIGDLSDTNALKATVEQLLLERIGNAGMEQLSTEQLGNIVSDVAGKYQFDSIANGIADAVSTKTQANVKSGRWWTDKVLTSVIDTGLKAVLVGGVIFAANKYTSRNTGKEVLPEATDSATSPFSDTGFTAAPRSLRKREGVSPVMAS